MSVMIGKSNLMNRMAKVSNMATLCVYIYIHTHISLFACVCVCRDCHDDHLRTYCCFVCGCSPCHTFLVCALKLPVLAQLLLLIC